MPPVGECRDKVGPSIITLHLRSFIRPAKTASFAALVAARDTRSLTISCHFLNYPELLAHTARSSFDPLDLADGNTDLFVGAPEETIEHIKDWLRLWIAIPNAVAGIRPLKRDLLIVIDEMPRLGYLDVFGDGGRALDGPGA